MMRARLACFPAAIMACLVQCVGPCFGSPSPEIAQELRQIAAAHQALSQYRVEIDVRYVGAASIHARVECMDAVHCTRNIGFLRVLETPEWSIAIDTTKRTMTVSHRTSQTPIAPRYENPDKFLGAWLQAGGAIDGGELTVEGRHWVFSPGGARPRTELYTDPASRLIRRLTYEDRDPAKPQQRVDVIYHWYDAADIDRSQFEINQYIEERGEAIVPASSYAGYEVIRADRH